MDYDTQRIEMFLDSDCEILDKAGNKFSTWRHWFKDVFLTLLTEGEGFSGKRPNCESGWEKTLTEALIIVDPEIILDWEYQGNDNSIPKKIDYGARSQALASVVNHIFRTSKEASVSPYQEESFPEDDFPDEDSEDI